MIQLDMTALFFNNLDKATRTFRREGEKVLKIEDGFLLNDDTKTITWSMMTRAGVTTTDNGAILQMDGKELELRVLEPAGMHVSVVSLDPPPYPFDKKIKDLKRIDVKVPRYLFEEPGENKIVVQMESR